MDLRVDYYLRSVCFGPIVILFTKKVSTSLEAYEQPICFFKAGRIQQLCRSSGFSPNFEFNRTGCNCQLSSSSPSTGLKTTKTTTTATSTSIATRRSSWCLWYLRAVSRGPSNYFVIFWVHSNFFWTSRKIFYLQIWLKEVTASFFSASLVSV